MEVAGNEMLENTTNFDPSPFLESLTLKNFTAFKQASFEFLGRGINVFVGENGTGKTHAMKAMFSWMLTHGVTDARDAGFVKTLLRTMQADSVDILIRHGVAAKRAEIWLTYGSQVVAEALFTSKKLPNPSALSELMPHVVRPVFIPAIEMIGHMKRFGATYDVYDLDFDLTVRDVVRLLDVSRRSPAPAYEEVLNRLEEGALQGQVEYDSAADRYVLVRGENRLPMPLVAEGLRKVATLHTLLKNGSIKRGTTLFWDEPEVNLNPILMDEIVEAMLAIARSGVQIFIATHSYVMLEELQQRARGGEVRYFAFEQTGDGVVVSPSETLAGLKPNKILEQYERLYAQKMRRAFAVNEIGRNY